MSSDTSWFAELEESVPAFLQSLKPGTQAGRYLPCRRGATAVGKEMGLGWSCFAAKTLHILNRWSALELREREEWVKFIQSFQREDGAFEDPPEMAYLQKPPGFTARILGLIGRGPWRPEPRSIMLAETKQAIATLAEEGASPRHIFRDVPFTPETVKSWLEAQNWARPWGAGGQSAGLVVFIKTQAPAFLPQRDVDELLDVCRDFFASIADKQTGAYFRGPVPAHGELINGAMKVLTALAWLDVQPHYAEALVRTCLAHPPHATGCHLVDAVYVLHQCLPQGGDATVRDYCDRVVKLIRVHANDDGGFSFNVRKAQTNYYGVPVSRGLAESDLQGTCLLVWALAMIQRLTSPEHATWRIIKP